MGAVVNARFINLEWGPGRNVRRGIISLKNNYAKRIVEYSTRSDS